MRLGIVGGGQLGLMLGEAARALDVGCSFLDPSPDAPARAVGELLVGAYDDEGRLDELAADVDVATYEFENVPGSAARHLATRVPLRPPAAALDVAQDRLREKELFTRLGIASPAFAVVDGRADLAPALDAVGLPAVLKRRSGGYDGKGQAVVRTPEDVDVAWESVTGARVLAETLVPFDRELSVLAVRSIDGATRTWPLVENAHEGGILRRSIAPAPDVSDATSRAARELVGAILDELDYVGVVAVELFDVGGELLANELAPRVHNSGHWTIEGAATSQFENHVRAVLGWPLGPTEITGTAAMVNCLGAVPDVATVDAVAGAHLHDYGKQPRPLRKLGHVTITAADRATLDDRLAQLRGSGLAF